MKDMLEFFINSYLKVIVLFIQLILSRRVVKFVQSCTGVGGYPALQHSLPGNYSK